MLRLAVLLLVAATLGWDGQPASAGQLKEADCSSSSFRFSAEGYQLDCERQDEQVHVGESAGTIHMDVMTISSDTSQMFLTMTAQTIGGTRIYFEYSALRTSFHNIFGDERIEEWRSVGRKHGYDIAEFRADIDGIESQCIAVQRYTNPAWTGYKRHIVGMGCTSGDLAVVYDVLAKLQAPGD